MESINIQIGKLKKLEIIKEGLRVQRINLVDSKTKRSQNISDSTLRITIEKYFRSTKDIIRLEKIVKQWYIEYGNSQSTKLLGGGNQPIQQLIQQDQEQGNLDKSKEQQNQNMILYNSYNHDMNKFLLNANYEQLMRRKNNLIQVQQVDAQSADQLKSEILNFLDKHKTNFRQYPSQYRSILYKLLTAYQQIFFWTIYEEKTSLTIDFVKRIQEIKALYSDIGLTKTQFYDIIDQLTYMEILEERKSKINFVDQRPALIDIRYYHYEVCYKFQQYEISTGKKQNEAAKGLEELIQEYHRISKPTVIHLDNDYYTFMKYKCDEMEILLNLKIGYLDAGIIDILKGSETLKSYYIIQYLQLIMHQYEDQLEWNSSNLAQGGHVKLQEFVKRLIKIYLDTVQDKEKEKQEVVDRILFLIYILLLRLIYYFEKVKQFTSTIYEDIQQFLHYIESSNHLPSRFSQFKVQLEISEQNILKEDFEKYSHLAKLKYEPTNVTDIHKYLETLQTIQNKISFSTFPNDPIMFEQNLVNLGGDLLEEYSDEVEELIEEAESTAGKSTAGKSEKMMKAEKEVQEKKKQYRKKRYTVYERVMHYYLNSQVNEKKLMLISAPIDSGKSSFVKKLMSAIDRLNKAKQQSLLIPIYLRISHFEETISSSSPLKEILLRDPFNFTYQQIEVLNLQQNENTKLLLILDGYNQSQNNKKLLLKFMNSSFYRNIHLLITTREENISQNIFYLRKTGYSLQELQTTVNDIYRQELESQINQFNKLQNQSKEVPLLNLAHLNKATHINMLRELFEFGKEEELKNKVIQDIVTIRDEGDLVEKFVYYTLYQSVLSQYKVSSQMIALATKREQPKITEAKCLARLKLCLEYLEIVAFSAFLEENKRKDEDYFADSKEFMYQISIDIQANLELIENIIDSSNLVTQFNEKVILFKPTTRKRFYFKHTSVFIHFLTSAFARDFAKEQFDIAQSSNEELAKYKIAQAPIARKPVTRIQLKILTNLFYKLFAIKYDPPPKIKKIKSDQKKVEEAAETKENPLGEDKKDEPELHENADLNADNENKIEEKNEDLNSQGQNSQTEIKEVGNEIGEKEEANQKQQDENENIKEEQEGEDDDEEEEELQSNQEGFFGINPNYKKFMKKSFSAESKNLNIGASNMMSAFSQSNMSLDGQDFREILIPDALMVQQYGRNMSFSEQAENNIITISCTEDLSFGKEPYQAKVEFSELISTGKDFYIKEMISFNNNVLFFISKENLYKYCFEDNKMRIKATINFNKPSKDALLLRRSDKNLFCLLGDYSLFMIDPVTMAYKELKVKYKAFIVGLAVSACGKFVALQFQDYHLRLFQLTEDQSLTELQERVIPVLYQFLKFVPNAVIAPNTLPDYLAVTYERTLSLINLKSNPVVPVVQEGEEEKTEDSSIISVGQGGSKFCWMDTTADYISTANFDGFLRVYQRSEQKWVLYDENQLHRDYIRHTQFSSCGKFIVSTSDDYRISVYHIESQTAKYLETIQRSYILNGALLDNNTKVAYTFSDKLGISVSNLSHLIKTNAYENNENGIKNEQSIPQQSASDLLITQITRQDFDSNCISFSEDNNVFASGSPNGSVSIYQIVKDKGQVILELNQILQGHSSEVTALAYSPSNNLLASCSNDYSIQVWKYSMSTYQKIDRGVLKHGDSVSSIVFSPDSTKLASGGWDEVVKIWKIKQDQYKNFSFELEKRIYNQQAVLCVAYSPSGELFAYGSIDENITICKSSDDSYQELQKINTKSGWVYSLNFSMNGKYLFAGTESNMYKVFDIKKNFFTVFEQTSYNHQTNALQSLKNGEIILTGTLKCRVQAHKLQIDNKFKQLQYVYNSEYPINGLAVSKKENYIAYGSQYQLSILKFHKNQERIPYTRHEDEVCYLKFIPNGLLVSVDYSGVLKLFDSKTHFKEILSMKVNDQQIKQQIKLVFSYNCEYFITHNQNSVQIWDKNFKSINSEAISSPPATSYFFSPSGQYLASSSMGEYKVFKASDKFQKAINIVPDKSNLSFNQYKYLYLQQEKKIPLSYFCRDQFVEFDDTTQEFSMENINQVTFSCDEKYMFIKAQNFSVFDTQNFKQINKIEVDENINPNLLPYYYEQCEYFETQKVKWGDRMNHFYQRCIELPRTIYSDNNKVLSKYQYVSSVSQDFKYITFGNNPTCIQVWSLQDKIRDTLEEIQVEVEESEEEKQQVEEGAHALADQKAEGEQLIQIEDVGGENHLPKQEEKKEDEEQQEGDQKINLKDQQKSIEGPQMIFENVGDNLELIDDYHNEDDEQGSQKSNVENQEKEEKSQPQPQIVNDEDSEEGSQKKSKILNKSQSEDDSSQGSSDGEEEGSYVSKPNNKSVVEQQQQQQQEHIEEKQENEVEKSVQSLGSQKNIKVKKTKIIQQLAVVFKDTNEFPIYLF